MWCQAFLKAYENSGYTTKYSIILCLHVTNRINMAGITTDITEIKIILKKRYGQQANKFENYIKWTNW